MSGILDTLAAEHGDMVIDFGKLKDIRAVEDFYNNKGEERFNKLEALSKVKYLPVQRTWFTFGYAECGQDMHTHKEQFGNFIKLMEEKVISINKYMESVGLRSYDAPEYSGGIEILTKLIAEAKKMQEVKQ